MRTLSGLFGLAVLAGCGPSQRRAPQAANNPCRQDHFRLCSQTRPGTDAARLCLVNHMNALSEGCRAQIRQRMGLPAIPAEPMATQAAAVAEAPAAAACRQDFLRYCRGRRAGTPAARQCLARNFPRFSPACRQSVRRPVLAPAAMPAAQSPVPAATDSVQAPAPAAPAGVTKDELMEMLKEVAAESSAKEGQKSAAIVSDVDNPKLHLPERPDDVALVVGVEKYVNDLPDATFAERDADAVRAELVALGWPERNVKLLKGQRASLSALAAHVEDWLPRMVKGDSRVFVYFSGHGAPDPESHQAYLVPVDGDPKFLDKTAYPLRQLYAKLGALNAGEIVVALDSCFSGSGGRSVLAPGARPLVTRVETAGDPSGKLVIYSAAASDEITSTLPDQGHGIFTYYFLRGLAGGAKTGDGAITSKSLYDYLKPKVADAASRQNRDQTPGVVGPQQQELVRFR